MSISPTKSSGFGPRARDPRRENCPAASQPPAPPPSGFVPPGPPRPCDSCGRPVVGDQVFCSTACGVALIHAMLRGGGRDAASVQLGDELADRLDGIARSLCRIPAEGGVTRADALLACALRGAEVLEHDLGVVHLLPVPPELTERVARVVACSPEARVAVVTRALRVGVPAPDPTPVQRRPRWSVPPTQAEVEEHRVALERGLRTLEQELGIPTP